MPQGRVGCYDCGRPYGDEHGFSDLVVSNDVWRQITPTADLGGLLCPSCIIKRMADRGIKSHGAFMSGPLRSVSPELMETFRWMENLREQGHGWSCPECGGGRRQDAQEEPAARPSDPELVKFLAGVVGAVEATSYEHMCLFHEERGRSNFSWRENLEGRSVVVGSVGDMPVCVALRVDEVRGYRILFYEVTSQLVNYVMVDAWLEANLPATARHRDGRVNKTDAMNFHNVFPR